jgi:hypothetical protein
MTRGLKENWQEVRKHGPFGLTQEIGISSTFTDRKEMRDHRSESSIVLTNVKLVIFAMPL